MSPPIPSPRASPRVREPTCPCGHGPTHHMVSAAGEHTFGGWCLILLGISAKPRAIRFQCRVCDQIILVSRDPKVIAETRIWG